jgi:hypothetical protein
MLFNPKMREWHRAAMWAYRIAGWIGISVLAHFQGWAMGLAVVLLMVIAAREKYHGYQVERIDASEGR